MRFFVVNKHKQKNNTTKKKQKDQVPSPESLPSSSSSSSSFSSSCTHSHPVAGVHEEEKEDGRDSGRRQCARFSSQALFAKKAIAFQLLWKTYILSVLQQNTFLEINKSSNNTFVRLFTTATPYTKSNNKNNDRKLNQFSLDKTIREFPTICFVGFRIGSCCGNS